MKEWLRPALVMCAGIAATGCALVLVMLDRVVWHRGDLVLAGYVVLLSWVLPLRSMIVCVAGAGIVYAGLYHANAHKVAVTQMPVTIMDLRIALANPHGLMMAVGLPPVMGHLAVIGAVILAIAGGWQVLRVVRAARTRPIRIAVSALAAVVILSATVLFASAHVGLVASKAERGRAGALWEARHLARLSREVGLVTFILFTAAMEQRTGAWFFAETDEVPLGIDEIREDLDRYVVQPVDDGISPDIVVVHLESTFDPNAAFHLTTPVKSALFERGPLTHMIGAARVNVLGGGSWVTEFEILTGLDSRLFGFLGHYAHSSIAPYVTGAFPTYLQSKGYRTVAFYSWPGRFYNARNAFQKYGFDVFLDADDLGLVHPMDALGWSGATRLDERMAAAVIDRLRQESSALPLFAFVGFGENHGPHACRHFRSPSEFPTTLRDTDDFPLNCQLNEYVRRLDSTAAGYLALRTFLEERQQSTTRPFVLMGYGDHQPHTFTGTYEGALDYRPFRTNASAKETLLVLESTVPPVLDCCGGAAVPATLLPSLLSAYVTPDPLDYYLPVNLSLFARCGADPFGPPRAPSSGNNSSEWRPQCREMRRALPILQRAGILQ